MPTVQWRRAAVKTRGYKGLAYARAAAGVSVGGTLQNRERDAASSGGRARHLATHSLDGALAAPCPRWEATPPATQIPQGNREGGSEQPRERACYSYFIVERAGSRSGYPAGARAYLFSRGYGVRSARAPECFPRRDNVCSEEYPIGSSQRETSPSRLSRDAHAAQKL